MTHQSETTEYYQTLENFGFYDDEMMVRNASATWSPCVQNSTLGLPERDG
jgi:hypothetical protein